MRPTSLQDALLRAKPLVKEVRRKSNHARKFPQIAGSGRGGIEPSHQGFTHQNPPARGPGSMQPKLLPSWNSPIYGALDATEWVTTKISVPRKLIGWRQRRLKYPILGKGMANQQRGGRGNRGRGRGRAARMHGRGRGQAAHVNATIGEPTLAEEEGDRAQLFAAIDNPGAPQQYAVIQTTADHEGKEFKLLIDCGSTHSFLSPRCLRKLKLNQYPIKPMTVELANGKEVISRHTVGTVDFELGGKNHVSIL